MFATNGYRRFLAVQTLLLPTTQGLVFFSLYGRREFHLDLKVLGLLLISDAVAPLVGNFIWGRLAERLGNRWVLGGAALVSVGAPALALWIGLAGETRSPSLLLAAFGAIVFALSVASAGVDLASKNYVLDLAPDVAGRSISGERHVDRVPDDVVSRRGNRDRSVWFPTDFHSVRDLFRGCGHSVQLFTHKNVKKSGLCAPSVGPKRAVLAARFSSPILAG